MSIMSLIPMLLIRPRSSSPVSALLAVLAATAACTPAEANQGSGPGESAAHAAAALRVPLATPSGRAAPARSLLEAPDKFLTRGDTTIRYREIGRGEPVLLLHGYSDRAEMWRKAADSLAWEYRVIVPDLRGFGMSTRFSDTRQYGKAMLPDVVALLDSLHLGSVHVVGYSLGAVLAANLALHDASRVRSATLVAGPFLADSAGMARLIAPHLAALERGEGIVSFMRWILPTWPDSIVRDASAGIYAANDSGALVASLRAMPELMLNWDAVRRTRVPAMAIVGRVDPLLPYSRDIARAWPGITLRELEGNDHAVIPDSRELVQEFRRLAARVDAVRR